MKSIFGNYDIKVGDVLIAKDDLINANAFTINTRFRVYDIEDEYIFVKLLNTNSDYITGFHIESQNAELCILATREIREEKLKKLLDEA